MACGQHGALSLAAAPTPVALHGTANPIPFSAQRKTANALRLESLCFAKETPYQTNLAPPLPQKKPVMPPAVAKALQAVLSDVVTKGTAVRLAGAFNGDGGTPIIAGGKTGSGDNRFKTFASNGEVLTSQAVNRTAIFVFYIGDRYFGVISASVLGREAEDFSFTSSLPVAVLKLLAPELIDLCII